MKKLGRVGNPPLIGWVCKLHYRSKEGKGLRHGWLLWPRRVRFSMLDARFTPLSIGRRLP